MTRSTEAYHYIEEMHAFVHDISYYTCLNLLVFEFVSVLDGTNQLLPCYRFCHENKEGVCTL